MFVFNVTEPKLLATMCTVTNIFYVNSHEGYPDSSFSPIQPLLQPSNPEPPPPPGNTITDTNYYQGGALKGTPKGKENTNQLNPKQAPHLYRHTLNCAKRKLPDHNADISEPRDLFSKGSVDKSIHELKSNSICTR